MGQELGVGVGQLVTDDLDGIDLEALEEGLVEKAALGGRGLPVSGLDVGGERERGVERAEDLLAVDGEVAHRLLDRDPLAADALLLVVVELLGDTVGVVAVEQLALLALQAAQLAPSSGALDVSGPGQLVQMRPHGLGDPLAMLRREFDRRVVALDGVLDQIETVVALGAGTVAMASAADEVVVGAAVAAYPCEEQPAAALATEQRSAQVAVMTPAPLAALAL